MISRDAARLFLAQSGRLRVAINLSNVLLVSSKNPLKGVAPSFASVLARYLDVKTLELVPYDHPNLVCDAATADEWDVALIGADPLRGEHIAFTRPYCEIRATLMVRTGGNAASLESAKAKEIESLADLDEPGRKIISKHGGAYDLWLQKNLRHATLVPAETLDESYETFKEDRSIDALAGLRSKLEGDLAKEPAETRKGYRVLDSDFMSVQQAIGVRKRKSASAETTVCTAVQISEHLNTFVSD